MTPTKVVPNPAISRILRPENIVFRLFSPSSRQFASFAPSSRALPMADPFPAPLVSPQELFDALQRQQQSPTGPKIIPLSSAWFMPNDPEGRSGYGSFEKHRIPHSQYLDLDKVSDTSSPWPHMLPSVSEFSKYMGFLGVRQSDCVVFFDTPELGLFSAPRAAWMLKHFGHPHVHVLNNFKLWLEQDFPVESGDEVPADIQTYDVPATELSSLSVDFEEVQDTITSNLKETGNSTLILDARPSPRWSGQAAEPRQGISSGHMATSVNLPYTDVLDPKTKAMLPKEQLVSLFRNRLSGKTGNVISTCGTGVSAAVVDLALEIVDFPEQGERKIYDGSWTEWASRLREDTEGWIVKS